MAEPAARGHDVPGGSTIGLVVNPIAGIGGRVGLKGSDGAATVERALALGAVPGANRRAVEALLRLRLAWPAGRPLPRILAAPGEMGERAARSVQRAWSWDGYLPELLEIYREASARSGRREGR